EHARMEPGKIICVFYIRIWILLAVMALATQNVTGKTLKYQVYEEQKVGTVIARLKEDVADVFVKLPSSVSLRFRAMQRGSTNDSRYN
uniref:Cadherin N-terminal domain-containing protein n=2 Tax=Hucho hucho TaxID=62062 RepID=A0A4W5JJ26_9TELE